MENTDYMRRNGTYLWKGKRITIIEISKLSVKFYNETDREFSSWVSIKEIEPMRITQKMLEEVNFNVVPDIEFQDWNHYVEVRFKGVLVRKIKYVHQLSNLLSAIYQDVEDD